MHDPHSCNCYGRVDEDRKPHDSYLQCAQSCTCESNGTQPHGQDPVDEERESYLDDLDGFVEESGEEKHV